jgi:aldehyde dehydrogenase (NAD+)
VYVDQNSQKHNVHVVKIQFNRVMSYIEAGKKAGATVALGGNRLGDKVHIL